MKRKTFYIIAGVWFAMIVLILLACYTPIVDPVTQEEVKKYMVLAICVGALAVSYTHLRAHETGRNLVCRLLLEKKKERETKRKEKKKKKNTKVYRY